MFELIVATALLQVPPPQTSAPSADVVVKGLRDIDRPDSPVTHQTLGSMKSAVPTTESRQAMEASQLFAECAFRRGQAINLLRGALDGAVNEARQRSNQIRFVQANAACATDPRRALNVGVAAGQGSMSASVGGGDGSAPGMDKPTQSNEPDSVMGGSGSVTNEMAVYYDRGALFLELLRREGDKLILTPEMMKDGQVHARFDTREVPLARYRLPLDREYFEIAVCMVRLQPALAVKLVQVQEAATIARVEAAIVNRARACVGNAKKVYFDPTQFRFYIADAVYRWSVAARGVDTLIAIAPPPRVR